MVSKTENPTTPGNVSNGRAEQLAEQIGMTMSNLAFDPSPASTYGGTTAAYDSPFTPDTSRAETDEATVATSAASTTPSSIQRVVKPCASEDPFLDSKHIQEFLTGLQAGRGSAGFVRSAHQTPHPEFVRALDCRRSASVQPPVDRSDGGVTLSSDTAGEADSIDADEEDLNSHNPSPHITAENAQALLPPKACVFVANLASSETDQALTKAVNDVFSKYGPVWVKIRRDHTGMPFAFCQYTSEHDAQSAVYSGRDQMVIGRPCRTEPAKVNRSIYLSKMTGARIDEREARSALNDFGPIEAVWWPSETEKAMYQLSEGIWVKFGFFQDCREVQWAFRGHAEYRVEQPSVVGSHNLGSRYAPAQVFAKTSAYRSEIDQRSIFIGNLPPTTTKPRLTELFSQYGHIRRLDLIHKHYVAGNGLRVFAFIEFTNNEEAMQGLREGHGQYFHGRLIRVERKTSPGTLPGTPHQPLRYGPTNPPQNDMQSELDRARTLLEQQQQLIAYHTWHATQRSGPQGPDNNYPPQVLPQPMSGPHTQGPSHSGGPPMPHMVPPPYFHPQDMSQCGLQAIPNANQQDPNFTSQAPYNPHGQAAMPMGLNGPHNYGPPPFPGYGMQMPPQGNHFACTGPYYHMPPFQEQLPQGPTANGNGPMMPTQPEHGPSSPPPETGNRDEPLPVGPVRPATSHQ